ncbi:hypothetical protein [Devosia sp. DBB001]|nr:hypothetical protein GHV40_00660 [Devosia sp. D6-9]CDP52231.1 hypothetical protein [Devosia sp. DBB001]
MNREQPAPKKFPWAIYWLILAAILLFALWPVFSVTFVSLVADANGCRVDEGSVHPCMVLGSDWGELLYGMGVMGWFMLATIPIGIFALGGWLVALIAHRIAWRRNARRQGS